MTSIHALSPIRSIASAATALPRLKNPASVSGSTSREFSTPKPLSVNNVDPIPSTSAANPTSPQTPRSATNVKEDGGDDIMKRLDVNNDGHINILDIIKLVDGFAHGSQEADFDGDGEVNRKDIALYLKYFEQARKES